MQKYVLSIVCLCLMGCGHTSPKQEEETVINPDVEQIRIADFDYGSYLNTSELFDSIRFVPLETTEESLIGNISKIIATEDRYIVCDYWSAKAIFVFDKNGKFLNRIGKQGEGPGEYDHPADAVYDKYNNELLILCHNRKVIMRYTLNDEFLGEIPLGGWVMAISVVDRDAFLVYFNNSTQVSGKPYKYNIRVIDGKGKTLYELLPVDEDFKMSPYSPDAFSFYQDELLFAPYYSKFIYSLKNGKLEEKYYLDFGEHAIPSSLFKDVTYTEFDKKNVDGGNYAFMTASFETQTHVVCHFIGKKRRAFHYFYCKKSKKAKTTSMYFNDISSFPVSKSHAYKDGNQIISYIEPEAFKQMFVDNSAITHPSQEETDFVNSIEETDNPILWITKLKEF